MDTKIVKYDFNKLELIDDNELLKLKDSGSTILDDFPIVYVLRNEKEAYIGESEVNPKYGTVIKRTN